MESSGRPKFLGNPAVPLPCSSTPAGSGTPCPGGVPMLPPLCPRRRLPRVVLSGLNRTALALAVYASSGGSPLPGRKTRFRLLAKLYRVGLVTHRVPTRGFQGVVVTSFPPLPSFAWRKDTIPNWSVCRASVQVSGGAALVREGFPTSPKTLWDSGPGRPGDCSPGLPLIRTCPIKAYGSSSHGFATHGGTQARGHGNTSPFKN